MPYRQTAVRGLGAGNFHRRYGLRDYSTIGPGGSRIISTGNPPGTNPVSSGGGGVNLGPGMNYPAGSLVAAAGVTGVNPVYVIQNGQACWIPDQNTLYAMGYNWSDVKYIPAGILARIPVGPPVQQVITQQTTASTPATSAAASTPTISTVLEPGATLISSGTYAGMYQNPDGTIYDPSTAPAGSSSTYSTTATFSSVLESGAVPITTGVYAGMYQNPDGTIYDPSTASSSSSLTTFDITEPSTWPTWVWLALAAGGTWLVFFKSGRR